MPDTPYDVAIIGAGFGGLGAALRLAEAGARVVVFETLGYPGGCAGTFTRRGLRFEAGATLSAGFAPGQLFRTWIDRYGLDLKVTTPDPMVRLRAPGLRLDVRPERAFLVEAFQRLPGAPVDALARFFDLQRRVGDALWPLFDDPDLLPPWGAAGLLRHAGRAAAYLPLARLVGRPLMEVVDRFGLAAFSPLRTWLDAVCQITVQTSAARAEAPFALAALDYFFRGAGHVEGGIGALAQALVTALRGLGGEVRTFSRVKALRREGGRWRLTTRGGEVVARAVAANLLPQDLRSLMGDEPTAADLSALIAQVRGGWSAALLYLTLDGAAPPGHLELVQDESAPFIAGNHLFSSVGDLQPDPDGGPPVRTATVSTHVDPSRLRGAPPEEVAATLDACHGRMREGLAALAPEVWGSRRAVMTASPRTFLRFTGRAEGLVGGIPRIAGLSAYRSMGPIEAAPGLFLVGDSAFPGQSTLATALGGCRAAAAIARAW